MNHNCVSMAIDISRVADVFAENQLSSITIIGRELDLLERMRRTEERTEIPLKLVKFHASGLGLSIPLVERSLESFSDSKLVSISADTLDLQYDSTEAIYKYGINRLNELCCDAESKLLELLSSAMSKPQDLELLDQILEMFDRPFRNGLRSFLFANDILAQITTTKEEYLVSPRIYRDKAQFKSALEVLEAEKLGDVIHHLQSNPGYPQEEVSRALGLENGILDVIDKSGIVDPINLNVSGNAKTYLFSSDLISNRSDQDHLDLVKKTLANFRYGEHYSHRYRLRDLKAFLDYMLDHGYAGKADPIGTDYHNIELDGVVRVSQLSDGRYRFWMLKKDVIRDVRSILDRYTPIQLEVGDFSLSSIDNVISTRSQIKILASDTIEKVTDAVRQIQEGMVK